MPEDKPSLLKQLLGAGVGMLIALALFEGYSAIAPSMQPYLQASIAYLFPPGTSPMNPPRAGVRMADTDASEDKMERIAARARVVVQRLSSSAPSSMAAVPLQPYVPAIEEEKSSVGGKLARAVEEIVSGRKPSVRGSAASSVADTERAGEPVKAMVGPGGPNLPNSGVTLWVATLIALGGSTVAVPRVRKWVMPRA